MPLMNLFVKENRKYRRLQSSSPSSFSFKIRYSILLPWPHNAFYFHICREASVEVEIMKLTVRPDEHPVLFLEEPAVFFISNLSSPPLPLLPLLSLLPPPRRLDVPPRERLNCRPPACTRPFECR